MQISKELNQRCYSQHLNLCSHEMQAPQAVAEPTELRCQFQPLKYCFLNKVVRFSDALKLRTSYLLSISCTTNTNANILFQKQTTHKDSCIHLHIVKLTTNLETKAGVVFLHVISVVLKTKIGQQGNISSGKSVENLYCFPFCLLEVPQVHCSWFHVVPNCSPCCFQPRQSLCLIHKRTKMRSQAFERKNVFAERTTKVAEAMAQLVGDVLQIR